MKTTLSVAAALFAAMAVSSPSRAETYGLRIGLEAPIYSHYKGSGYSASYSIGDSLQPAINLLASYKPDPVFAFELELREGFAHTGGSRYDRTGTAIGPGLRLQPMGLPIYARASLPIHVEPSPVVVGFRAAAGLELGLPAVSLYLEGAADFSLAGGSVSNLSGTSTSSSNVGPFDQTVISAGAGAWFKF